MPWLHVRILKESNGIKKCVSKIRLIKNFGDEIRPLGYLKIEVGKSETELHYDHSIPLNWIALEAAEHNKIPLRK